jgi:uncharacterized protein YjbI with pentapeptide repeats
MRILRKKDLEEGSGGLALRWHTGGMANPEHLAKLKEAVEARNRWREENPKIRPSHLDSDLAETNLAGANLFHADLFGADLSGAYLYGANLGRTDLRAANLTSADLGRTDLREANLTHTSLSSADLSYVDLSGASLERANLAAANLTGANLAEADLTGAFTNYTTFADVDLSKVKGLETVVHNGPSSIGIDTIYKSKGKIPHVFLRGAGVPDNFITYMASLVGTGIEFYSLFISYSTKDQEFAECLHNDLQAKGVRCWFAPHDLRGGEKLHVQIDEAIRVYDKLLLIHSPASMESEWVKTEISKARKREIKEGKRILFPIRLSSFETLRDWECFDADAGKDSAREIREYFIPDFSNWKDHDAYERAFDRLLSYLQGKPAPVPA